ncbi:MAG: alcohol dehydrogenase [Thelocarpon superellum]|nr:MAG: alcohol dehydrogenase [Thelocarpon superellum]
MQWAQVFEKSGGPVEYKKIPVPTPGADEVLVNVKFSGVCHTDLHALQGDWPLDTKLPLVGGHEGAGVVVSRGALVEEVEVGDNVGIKVGISSISSKPSLIQMMSFQWINGTCLACDFCQQSDEPLCAKASLSGYTVDGTFQQYAVARATHVAHLPKDVAMDKVAPILCAGVTVYKGLKESGARPGQVVAVTGAGGGLGVLALQYAKAMGLQTIAIDEGEEKREMCEKYGTRAFVDFATSHDLVKDVQAATDDGLGPHAVLVVAVAEKSFEQAIENSYPTPMHRDKDAISTYIYNFSTLYAHTHDDILLTRDTTISAPIFSVVTRMISIKGSYVGSRHDTAEALSFWERGLIDCPIKIVGLSQLSTVYDQMRAGKIAGRLVLDTSK